MGVCGRHVKYHERSERYLCKFLDWGKLLPLNICIFVIYALAVAISCFFVHLCGQSLGLFEEKKINLVKIQFLFLFWIT